MKLILYGTGMIGSRILSEALLRGHNVTVVKRDVKKISPPGERTGKFRQRFTLGY